ncbi:MAG: DUF1778 domain-containing protein [Phycisphaeraceae bacterium]|nr:DUF1778 domain-containing protein [Phycisphaeraceae bacterium]
MGTLTINNRPVVSSNSACSSNSLLCAEETVIKISGSDRDAFLNALETDHKPTNSLLDAVRRYRAEFGR